jgi:hypothetical protein
VHGDENDSNELRNRKIIGKGEVEYPIQWNRSVPLFDLGYERAGAPQFLGDPSEGLVPILPDNLQIKPDFFFQQLFRGLHRGEVNVVIFGHG